MEAEILEKLAIREVIGAYSQALNDRDWASLGDLFADDGAWECSGKNLPPERFLRIEGKAMVVKAIEEMVGPMAMIIQMTHSSVIEVDGDRATAASTIEEVMIFSGTTGSRGFGTYRDELVKTSNGWKFRERRFDTIYSEPREYHGSIVG